MTTPGCATCGRPLPDGARFCPHDGRPIAGFATDTGRDPLVGMMLAGRYRISHRIGAGAQSIVYLARQKALERDVAVKVLRAEAASSVHVERLAREARALSAIDHENVVYALELGHASEGDFYFLVMEHAAGTPLDIELARRGPLPPRRAVHIVSQVAAGMSRAHELGIVHRDLKPANVMLCPRRGDPDFVKLLDFGISKPAVTDPGSPAMTVAGQLFGTPAYMAPEQWAGEAVDARTDLYALGVLAYELLTGAVPFHGTTASLLKQHLMDAPPSPRARTPEIPVTLERVVLRCLEKRPEARFASTAELLAALGPVWSDVPPAARRTTYVLPARVHRESLPDPTVYASSDLDVVWDGPSLCEELVRLHALRRKRLSELAAALWTGPAQPPEIAALVGPISALERELDRASEELALLEARMNEADRAGREGEAQVRVQIVDAGLGLAVIDQRLPARVTARLSALGAAGEESSSLDLPTTRKAMDRELRAAEHRLAGLVRRRTLERAELEAAVATKVLEVRGTEISLGPLYAELSRVVQGHASRRPEVRPLVVAFAQIDGAIASYQALLEMMDTAG